MSEKVRIPINDILLTSAVKTEPLELVMMLGSLKKGFVLDLSSEKELHLAIKSGFQFHILGHPRLTGDEVIEVTYRSGDVFISGLSMVFYNYLVESGILEKRQDWDDNIVNGDIEAEELPEEEKEHPIRLMLPKEPRTVNVYAVPGKLKTYTDCPPEIKIAELIAMYMTDVPNFQLSNYDVSVNGIIVEKHGIPLGVSNELQFVPKMVKK